jgi:Lon protease-like protein
MYELPLFPLQAVLFPGTPLRLHIFEERYKRMINLCIHTGNPFGVVLIRQGVEALGALAEPYLVGCSAQIIQIQHLPEGRMNIVATGLERFNVLSLNNQSQPYLVGWVEPYPLREYDTSLIGSYGKKLRSWVERYLRMLADAGFSQFDIDLLPGDPPGLAYLAATFVQMSDLEKQEILSLEWADDLVKNMIQVYRREIAIVKAMLSCGAQGSGVIPIN